LYAVAGFGKFSNHFRQARPLGLGAYCRTSFCISQTLVQNLSNDARQPVPNTSNSLLVFRAGQQTVKDYRCMRRLIQ
jgi:hypothetical protein